MSSVVPFKTLRLLKNAFYEKIAVILHRPHWLGLLFFHITSSKPGERKPHLAQSGTFLEREASLQQDSTFQCICTHPQGSNGHRPQFRRHPVPQSLYHQEASEGLCINQQWQEQGSFQVDREQHSDGTRLKYRKTVMGLFLILTPFWNFSWILHKYSFFHSFIHSLTHSTNTYVQFKTKNGREERL